MYVIPEFPEHRLEDRKRQAELRVHRQLADSDAEGAALYEIRGGEQSKEVDFAIWLADVGRYGGHVKGGHYRYEKGVLYLRTLDGEERKPGLLKQAKDSTMALHDYLKERIADKRCSPFTVPVIIFADMEPDSAIEAAATQAGVKVLFGTDRLVERLIELAASCNFFYPPTAENVAEEVGLLMPGLGYTAPETTPRPTTPTEVRAQDVIIQHADTVNVYTTGDPDPEQETAPTTATPTEVQAQHVIIQHADTVNIHPTDEQDPEQEVSQSGG